MSRIFRKLKTLSKAFCIGTHLWLSRKQMTHDSVTHFLAESKIGGYREENVCVTKATLYKETPTRGPARRAFVLLIYCII